MITELALVVRNDALLEMSASAIDTMPSLNVRHRLNTCRLVGVLALLNDAVDDILRPAVYPARVCRQQLEEVYGTRRYSRT